MNSNYILTIRGMRATIYEEVGGDTVCIYQEEGTTRSELFKNALEAFAEIVEENQ